MMNWRFELQCGAEAISTHHRHYVVTVSAKQVPTRKGLFKVRW